ncbi:2-succinyl-5-enolpyruvyl-6-hydroxy-3-cyclohexene-1-carboxylic-acid synthase [Vibrio mimicus]|uniref:2-succinyl-5-enolpyruvyl-6-hydroxy-3- cyclohexene-1-carboxylic-acid synthase n=1 Tax=Vibrio mimicus TaxID=674 RepID=UPI0001BAD7A7|nr:2-succinyl-5-enolpyruvyl-6-hydroxy-3-cyclohexene-1-carboxylic-acid synthase [Vibrio mimicus]EEY44468.1 2-succinyl-5-enolpyruvyl-6-hydroxy-3-cyclohexene-1-carboxylic-acid synthase [Vibrio mimicus VM223]
MNHDQALLNRLWSRVLLEELSRLGVTQVCVAPGSRSTPLTLEAHANAAFTLHTHYDERGLGFMALGLAKASQQPVAVIVTSGTAVANLLPAIAESKLTGERLVVLTADRPPELVGCGANQAIVQSGIFSHHVNATLDLPSPAIHHPLTWLLTSIDNVMTRQALLGGSVHINCPFPEPLYSAGDEAIYQPYLASVQRWREHQRPFTERHQSLAQSVPSSLDGFLVKGVVIVGSLTSDEAQAAQRFAQAMGWPLLCDPQSGISSEWAHFDLWLQHQPARDVLNQCEVVVQFGSRIVSKRLAQWLANWCGQARGEYHYVSPQTERNNPWHAMQQQWVCDIPNWVEALLSKRLAGQHTQQGWADALIHYAQSVRQLAQLHFSASALSDVALSEVALALDLTERATQADLFLGNSLIVRLVDMFSALDGREVFSNRGASGIDGLVATASGVQCARQKPLFMLIGDTSLLYDLNSLALMRNPPQPTVIVVTNNDGGAIFDLLPVPSEQREALYQMPHGMDFAHAALQFGLAYSAAQTLEHYQTLVEEHFAQGVGTLLIEVKTPPQQASMHIKQLTSQLHAL